MTNTELLAAAPDLADCVHDFDILRRLVKIGITTPDQVIANEDSPLGGKSFDKYHKTRKFLIGVKFPCYPSALGSLFRLDGEVYCQQQDEKGNWIPARILQEQYDAANKLAKEQERLIVEAAKERIKNAE